MKKYLTVIMTFIIVISCIGCNKQNNKEKNQVLKKEINICTDMEDEDTIFLLNYMKNQYENKNPKYKVNINNISNLKEIKSCLNKNKSDLVITNRNNMIRLAKQGFIDDITKNVEDYKIKERYYDIITYYGMYGNSVYGLGMLPFSIEIVYNKDVAKKMNISYPKDLNEFYNLLKDINRRNINVPVILPEEVGLYDLLFSTIFNNLYFTPDLDQYYDSPDKYYGISKNIQDVFQFTNLLYKNNIIKPDIFRRTSLNEIKEMDCEKVPIMILTYGNNKIKKSQKLSNYEVMNFSNKSFKNPVIVKPIICVNNQSKDKNQVLDFLKFIFDEEFQGKLLKKGFCTANINLNKKIISEDKHKIIQHIQYSNKRNMVTSYEMPSKINESIGKIMISILNGNYTGDEWKQIIKKIYK